jgi:ABC-2 type transport system ATP-binding protein
VQWPHASDTADQHERSNSVISVRGLRKRYGGTVAVDGLSFDVRPGVVTGLLGPNGSGKSTTIRMILGLDRPSAGTATIDGRAYADLPAPLRQVGALLDASAADGARTARDHLRWVARAGRLPGQRVGEVLDLVGLTSVAGRRARTYSLGMLQRLGIAAALLGDPATLILDEPVNGLDPEGIAWVRGLLRELAAQGRTVLVASHHLAEMQQMAEAVLILGKGRLLADASVGELTRGGRRLEDRFLALTGGAVSHRGAPAGRFQRIDVRATHTTKGAQR